MYISFITVFNIGWMLSLQIDSLYLSHPKCRLDVSQDSRLKATSIEAKQWKDELGTPMK